MDDSAQAGRGVGLQTDLGNPFWQLAGADALSTVNSNSKLAREMIQRICRDGADKGIIGFPEMGTNFVHGKLEAALGARQCKISVVSLPFKT